MVLCRIAAARFTQVIATRNYANDTPALLASTQLQKLEEKQSASITKEGPTNIAKISGIPDEHVRHRLVHIYAPIKSCMQSGTAHLGGWEMEFDNRGVWENALMGWSSDGDPMSGVKLQFSTRSNAIAHCEKNGWKYFVEERNNKLPRAKPYDTIFSWDKRSRASTK